MIAKLVLIRVYYFLIHQHSFTYHLSNFQATIRLFRFYFSEIQDNRRLSSDYLDTIQLPSRILREIFSLLENY